MRLPNDYLKKYVNEKLEEIPEEEKHVDFLSYVRDKENRPVGVVVIKGEVCGWSICHGNDKWNKAFGVYKAMCRLGSGRKADDVRLCLYDPGSKVGLLIEKLEDVMKREKPILKR